MEETLDFNEKPKRPALITVLAILSWISSAFGGLQSLVNLIFHDARKYNALQQLELAKEQFEEMRSNFMSKLIERTMNASIQMIENFFFLSNANNFLVSALSALAVYWMFRLKRKGFILYSGVHLLGLIPLFYMNSVIESNTLMTFAVYVTVFFTVLFIGLYSIHLRKMN
ncbi:MAG: hypothetical protein ACK4K0_03060 [Flavobacteriales bacterium]